MATSPRIPLDHLSDTCRTLLIPLTGRAYGEQHFPELGFRDEKAQAIADRIDYDRALFLGDRRAVWGTILRTQVFDRITQEFIDRHPDGTVLNFGAGLCTRYFRVRPGAIRWLELDLPDVIALKQALCAPTDRYRLLAFDFTSDESWASLARDLDGPTLVLAEGVLMFLPPAGVDRVFTKLLELPASSLRISFDYLHPWVKRYRWLQPPSFRATGASYAWGTRSLGQLLRSHPRLRAVTDQALSAAFPLRLRVANRVVRSIAGSSLYDIAVVERT